MTTNEPTPRQSSLIPAGLFALLILWSISFTNRAVDTSPLWPLLPTLERVVGTSLVFLLIYQTLGAFAGIVGGLAFLTVAVPTAIDEPTCVRLTAEMLIVIQIGIIFLLGNEIRWADQSQGYWGIAALGISLSTVCLQACRKGADAEIAIVERCLGLSIVLPIIAAGILLLGRGRDAAEKPTWPRFAFAGIASLPLAFGLLKSIPNWQTVGGEWSASGSAFAESPSDPRWFAGWAWGSPTVILTLVAVGLVRAVFRRRRQARRGESAVTLALLASLIAGLSIALPQARSAESEGSYLALVLTMTAAMFGLMELATCFFDRLALEAPKPGPSDVPRV